MRFTPHPPDWRFAAIFIAGCLLRALQPGLVQYGIDEGVASALALQISHGVHFPLTGIMTSFGFHNPPLFLYLLAPATWITADPRAFGVLFAVAGSLAIWFACDATRRIAGVRAGLIAATIVALCPNAVEHSRRIWGHDLVIPFASMIVWCAVVSQQRGSWKFLALSFSLCAAAQSLHLSAAVCWLIPLTVLFGFRAAERWKAIAVGAAVLIVCYLPWIVADAENGFAETKLLLSLVMGRGTAQALGLPVSPHAAWALVLSDFWTNDLLGAARPFMVSSIALIASVVQTSCALVMLAMALWWSGISLQRRDAPRLLHAALLLGALAPLLLFGVVFRAAVPPYFLPALIPAAIAAACALDAMMDSSASRRWGLFIMILFAVSSVTLIAETRRRILLGAGTSIPATEKLAAIHAIRQDSPGGSALLMQDGRQSGTGIDVAYVVLAREESLRIAKASDDASLPIHVLVDHRTLLHAPVACFLRRQEAIEFPHLTIRKVPAAERGEWTLLLERNPAQRPAP